MRPLNRKGSDICCFLPVQSKLSCLSITMGLHIVRLIYTYTAGHTHNVKYKRPRGLHGKWYTKARPNRMLNLKMKPSKSSELTYKFFLLILCDAKNRSTFWVSV